MENNDNMYKYNKTISDQIILKIKTSCDGKYEKKFYNKINILISLSFYFSE